MFYDKLWFQPIFINETNNEPFKCCIEERLSMVHKAKICVKKV